HLRKVRQAFAILFDLVDLTFESGGDDDGNAELDGRRVGLRCPGEATAGDERPTEGSPAHKLNLTYSAALNPAGAQHCSLTVAQAVSLLSRDSSRLFLPRSTREIVLRVGHESGFYGIILNVRLDAVCFAP